MIVSGEHWRDLVIYIHVSILPWASLVAQLVKNPPAMWETWVQFLSWEESLEKGKATHSSILAWRIPRVAKSWTWLSDFHILPWTIWTHLNPLSHPGCHTTLNRVKSTIFKWENSTPWETQPHQFQFTGFKANVYGTLTVYLVLCQVLYMDCFSQYLEQSFRYNIISI